MAVSAAPPPAAASVPPQNDEAEVAVLGTILLTEQALDQVLVDLKLSPEDFYRPRHQLIFRSMLRLKEKAEPEAVDALTVCDDLARQRQLEEAGGTAYVHALPTMVPAAGAVRDYARIVGEHAMLRRLLGAVREIQEEVATEGGDPRALVERAEQKIFRAGHHDESSQLRSIEEVLHEELDKLERLSKEGQSLTGTPSGFKDLDEITGGFQPGNLIVLAARPAMGKCLTGSALIYDPTTGARRPMREVVAAIERGHDAWVASLDSDLKLRTSKATGALRNGRREVFRITTKLGRRIEATSNHPLLTVSGWQQVMELRPRSRIGVPRSLPRTGVVRQMPDHELVLLAALIADGSLTMATPRFCFGTNSPVLPEVERAVSAFGCQLRLGATSHGTACITAGRGSGPNPVRQLCVDHDLWGRRSRDKFVPEAILALDDAQIARFLAVLYGCDGHIHATERLRQIGYSTISERLAHDVQHLLLRLGIVSVIRRLRRKVYEGTETTAREVGITGQESLRQFCHVVGAVGKHEAVERLLVGLGKASAHTNTDTLPVEVWEEVLAAKGQRPWNEVSAVAGRPSSHNWHVSTRGLSRQLMGQLAVAIGDSGLARLAGSDLWWDEVGTIESIGEEETYDIEVPEYHNFVADDLVVHNSALATNIAENAAVDHGKAVALFSLEMSESELAQRFIASRGKIGGESLRKGRVKPEQWPTVLRATEKLTKAPLFVDDSSDIGVLELRAKARRLNQRHPLGLLIVDYLQLMRVEDPRDGRVEQVGKISRGLKILARELSIPVLAISQLSRAVEARPDKRPLMSDLRESGNLEQDADLVMFVFREDYYDKESERQGIADIIIGKHRNGPVGSVELTFLDRYPKFMSKAPDRVAVGTGIV